MKKVKVRATFKIKKTKKELIDLFVNMEGNVVEYQNFNDGTICFKITNMAGGISTLSINPKPTIDGELCLDTTFKSSYTFNFTEDGANVLYNGYYNYLLEDKLVSSLDINEFIGFKLANEYTLSVNEMYSFIEEHNALLAKYGQEETAPFYLHPQIMKTICK